MGGQRIDDHSSWVGSAGKDMVMPMGCKTKSMEAMVEGAGDISRYEDTEESIRSQQKAGVAKAKSQAMKPGYRN